MKPSSYMAATQTHTTEANYAAQRLIDGSQLNGRATTHTAVQMAGASPPTKKRGFRPPSRVDRPEYATHDKSTHRSTCREYVTLTVPDYGMHDAPFGRSWCHVRVFNDPRDYAASSPRSRRVTSRGVGRRYGRRLLRVTFLALCKIRLRVEWLTRLLCLPRCRDESNLSIIEIPRRAHHVTREVSAKQRPNERLAHALTIRGTRELLRKSVRRHNVCHMVITSSHAPIMSRHVTSYIGRNYVFHTGRNANVTHHSSRITLHVTATDNTRLVRQHVVDAGNTPPSPLPCPRCQRGKRRPSPTVSAPKFSPTYPRANNCSTYLKGVPSAPVLLQV